jgi:hypothetical protein
MKRILTMTAALVVLVAATAAAQAPAAPGPQTPAVTGTNFVDADGDGICDRFEAGTRGAQARAGKAQGPRDGTGQQARRGGGAGPRGGQAMGPGPGAGPGAATCDGTGPKGRGRRGGR